MANKIKINLRNFEELIVRAMPGKIDSEDLKEMKNITEDREGNINKAKKILKFRNKLLSGKFSLGRILNRTKYCKFFNGFINYVDIFPTISYKIHEIINK
jgi:hypothetical protein